MNTKTAIKNIVYTSSLLFFLNANIKGQTIEAKPNNNLFSMINDSELIDAIEDPYEVIRLQAKGQVDNKIFEGVFKNSTYSPLELITTLVSKVENQEYKIFNEGNFLVNHYDSEDDDTTNIVGKFDRIYFDENKIIYTAKNVTCSGDKIHAVGEVNYSNNNSLNIDIKVNINIDAPYILARIFEGDIIDDPEEFQEDFQKGVTVFLETIKDKDKMNTLLNYNNPKEKYLLDLIKKK